MDDRVDSYLQDRSSMEGTVQPKLAYPEGPLVKSDDAVDQGHAVSDSAASPSPIAYQDQGSNTAGDNTIDEDDRALYQLLRYHVNSEISSTSSEPQPTGSVPTPFPYPVVGASVPGYIAGNNNTGQPGVFASSSVNNASLGTHDYFHSTGFTNAAPSNNLTLNAPVASMTTAPTGTASLNMNAVSTNTAPANAAPVNAAPVNAFPVHAGPSNAAPANGPIIVPYQGHPLNSRRRRCVPELAAATPAAPASTCLRSQSRSPSLDLRPERLLELNTLFVCSLTEDETRFHLRDDHYKAIYPYIHYGNHEQGLYYFGIDQSNMDCPNI
ncbi:hypothetical protein K4K53_003899 [Colletotrichum sp. SAR 10_77]|nr:hypothetical protein K4K53_003899 [Colletotrichum sp. SAR 10_77]